MNSEWIAFIRPECFDLEEKTNFDEGDKEEVGDVDSDESNI